LFSKTETARCDCKTKYLYKITQHIVQLTTTDITTNKRHFIISFLDVIMRRGRRPTTTAPLQQIKTQKKSSLVHSSTASLK